MIPSNSTNHSDIAYADFDYSQTEKSILLWSLAIGTLISVWPFNYLYMNVGVHLVFAFAGFLSAASTVLIPNAAYMGIEWFLIARLLQGISYGACFAVIGLMTVRWASLKQYGVFIGTLTSFNSVSNAVTNPAAGILCESQYGWPAVYYLHGAAGVMIFVLWVVYYKDDPREHHRVSAIELEKIHRNKSAAYINKDKFVPYTAIMTNSTVLVIWLNAFISVVVGIFLLTYAPVYMKYVLQYSIENTGYLVTLQSFTFLPTRLAAGLLSDHIRRIPERSKMIVFNNISVALTGFILTAIAFAPSSMPVLTVSLISFIHAVMAFNIGGFYKCASFVAGQHSHFVIANIQFSKCLALFFAPLLVAVFVQNDSSQAQWRTVFLILAVALFLSNFLFCMVATDKPAKFTTLNKNTEAGVEKTISESPA